MTIQEKVELIEKLTNEVVEETKSDAFAIKSEINGKVASMMNVFGKTYIAHVGSLKRMVRDVE